MVDTNSAAFKAAVESAKAYMLRQAAGASDARATGAALFNDNYHPIDTSSLSGPNPVANILASLPAPNIKLDDVKAKPKKSVVDSVKNGAKDVTHRVLDILSRGTYASANAVLKGSDAAHHDKGLVADVEAAAKGFARGVAGKDKTTYSDVLKQNYPDMGKKERAVTGFVGDVLLDPTTYVGVGEAKVALKAGAKLIDKTAGTKIAGKIVTKGDKRAAEEAALAEKSKVKPGDIKVTDDTLGKAADLTVEKPNTTHSGIDWSKVTFNTTKEDKPQVAAVIPHQATEALPLQKIDETPIGEAEIPDAPEIPTQRTEAKPLDERSKRIAEINSRQDWSAVEKANRIKKVEKEFPASSAAKKVKKANEAKPNAVRDAKLNFEMTDKELKAAQRKAGRGTKINKADADRIAVRTAILSDPNLIIAKAPGKPDLTVRVLRKQAKTAHLNGDDQALAKINAFFDKAVAAKSADPEFIKKISRSIKMTETTVNGKTHLVPDVAHKDFEHGAITVHDMNGKFKGSHTPKALSDLLSGATKITKGSKVDPSNIAGDLEDLDNLYVHGDLHEGSFKSLSQVLAEMAPAKAGAKPALDPALVERHAAAKKALDDANGLPDHIEEEIADDAVPAGIPAPNVEPVVTAPTPTEVVEKALSGERVFDKPVTHLSPEQADGVMAALKGTVDREILEPVLTGKYPHKSKGGTLRSETTPNAGIGRNLKGFNEMSQGATLAKNILSHASKMLPDEAKKLKGSARGAAVREIAMPMMRAAWDAMEALGIKSVSGTKTTGFALALPDILEQVPTNILDRYFFDLGQQIAPSQWVRIAQDITEQVAKGAPVEETKRMIATTLHSPMSRSTNSTVALIANPGRGWNAYQIRKLGKSATAEQKAAVVAKTVQTAVDALTQPDVMKGIATAHSVSAARYAVQTGKKITSIQQKVVDSIVKTATDPSASPADVIEAVNRTSETARVAARDVGADAEEIAKAKTVADDDIAKVLSPADLSEARAAKHVKDAFGRPIGKDVSDAHVDHHIASVTRAKAVERNSVEVGAAEKLFDLTDDVLAVRQANRLSRIMWGVGQSFSTHVGQSGLRPEEWAAQSHYQQLAHLYNNVLDSVHKQAQDQFGALSDAKIKEAFTVARRGGEHTPETAGLVKSLTAALNQLDGIAERGGVTAAHLNEKLPRNGLEAFSFEPFTKASGLDQIKGWDDINDPLDFLARLHKSLGDATVDVTVADSFSSLGSKLGGPGLVKISDRVGKNRVAGLINKDLYYPKGAAEQLATMGRMHELLESMSKHDNSPALKTFDKLTRGWKTGMTIIRPGFHARNLFSDVMLSFLDGVHNPVDYQQAIRILRTHKGNIKGADNFAYLDSLSRELPDELSGKTGQTFRTRRGGMQISDDTLYKLASKQGLFPGYQAYADLTYGAAKEIKGKNVISAGIKKVVDGGGAINEVETNWTRTAHFIGALKDELPKIKNNNLTDRQVVELAAKRAAERVKKYHPDGSDMAAFERGVMRRVSMFYSWNRKAIPLMAEALVRRPGKAIIFPKAMYATATAMGIDPESLSTPFPTDTLFPNYMTDAFTGPQFKVGGDMFRINPGDPVGDTVTQWAATSGEGSDGVREGVASLNPWLRVPLELSIGRKWSTGGAITDKSDYLDSQIPLVNTASAITNRSITGGMQPKSSTVLGYDNNGQKVMDPDPSWFNATPAVNWATGLGIQNLTTPQAQKGGELDLRDALMQLSQKGQG